LYGVWFFCIDFCYLGFWLVVPVLLVVLRGLSLFFFHWVGLVGRVLFEVASILVFVFLFFDWFFDFFWVFRVAVWLGGCFVLAFSV